MRVLSDGSGRVAGTPLADDDVLAAYPWPEEGRWVRAMMVTTLDGAAGGPDGLSGSITSGADQAVFTAVRRLADVVLIGAGTMRAERYGPMLAEDADAERRGAAGQAPAPVLAMVSGSLGLPWDEPVFAESALTPIVLTTTGADPDALATAEQHADVVRLADLEARTILRALEERGLRRVVCEGGPVLLAAMVEADALDEADITLAPVFAGGTVPSAGPELSGVRSFALHHVLTGDDCLMMRYVRRDVA